MTTPTLSTETVDQLLTKWNELTRGVEPERPPIPLKILLGEATDLAALTAKHFHTTVNKDGSSQAGLETIVATGQIAENIADEILELQFATGAAHREYERLVEEGTQLPMSRAAFLLEELRALTAFVLEDGNHPRAEEQLAVLRDNYSEEQSYDGLAMALEAYAGLAKEHQASMLRVEGFDPEVLDESLRVAQSLRQRSADQLTGNVEDRQKNALYLRNRLCTALVDRMRRARRCFRFVFRSNSDLLRKASSEYDRERRRSKKSSAPPVSGVSHEDVTILGMPTPSAQQA